MTTITLEPELAEEAVFLALAQRASGDPQALAWRREHDALFALPATAERERAFREHALCWFERLELARPIRSALAACPRVAARIPALDVRAARLARDEGSEVLGDAACPRRVVLALAPRRCLDPRALEELVLRELLHAEDMLDPAFAFVPAFDPGPVEGHARAELVRDRLRVLWQARIQGRIERRGAPSAPPPAPGTDFHRAFGGPAERGAVEALFASAWSGALATYALLLAAARGSAPAGVHQARGACETIQVGSLASAPGVAPSSPWFSNGALSPAIWPPPASKFQ